MKRSLRERLRMRKRAYEPNIFFRGLGGSILTPTDTNFKIVGNYPLVTGTVAVSSSKFTTHFPFPNATGLSRGAFINSPNIEGEINLLNVYGAVDFYYIINNCQKVTAFRIPNATKIIDSNAPFTNTFSLTVLDIRNVTEWIDNGTSFTNPAQLTIHANIALQTAGSGGTMHPIIQLAINGGATIIWY